MAFGSGLLFIGFVVVEFLRFILRAPRVDFGVLCAGIATYLMLGLLWSFAYILVDRLVPNSFAFTIGSSPVNSMNHLMLFTSISPRLYLGTVNIPIGRSADYWRWRKPCSSMFYVSCLSHDWSHSILLRSPLDAVNSQVMVGNQKMYAW